MVQILSQYYCGHTGKKNAAPVPESRYTSLAEFSISSLPVAENAPFHGEPRAFEKPSFLETALYAMDKVICKNLVNKILKSAQFAKPFQFYGAGAWLFCFRKCRDKRFLNNLDTDGSYRRTGFNCTMEQE